MGTVNMTYSKTIYLGTRSMAKGVAEQLKHEAKLAYEAACRDVVTV